MGRHGKINSRDTTDSNTLDILKSLEEKGFHTEGLTTVILNSTVCHLQRTMVMMGKCLINKS